MGATSSVTYDLVPVVALADRLRFDGNEIRHVSTSSETVGVIEAAAIAAAEDGGEDEDDGSSDVLVCHNPGHSSQRTMSFEDGSGSLNAHLRHGDTVGAC